VAAPARALDRVEVAATRLFAAVGPPSGRRRLRSVPAREADALTERLSELALALTGGGDELDALARRALGAAANVERCRELDDLARVAWAEPDAIAWAPVDVSTELRERLWDGGPTAILVSATLGTGGDFGFVRDRLGLREADELAVD